MPQKTWVLEDDVPPATDAELEELMALYDLELPEQTPLQYAKVRYACWCGKRAPWLWPTPGCLLDYAIRG